MSNIPPPSLRSLYPGNADLRRYLLLGRKNLDMVVSAMRSQGLQIDTGDNVMEFGSGCGMTLRHWDDNSFSFYGLDPYEESVEWSQRVFPSAKFVLTDLEETTWFDDKFFSLIYSPHLFMSLTEELQDKWLVELNRILKPGGMLVVFLRGERESRRNLEGDALKCFNEGELIVVGEDSAGTSECHACHPRSYAEKHFSQYLPVIDYEPAQVFDVDGLRVGVKAVCVMRRIG